MRPLNGPAEGARNHRSKPMFPNLFRNTSTPEKQGTAVVKNLPPIPEEDRKSPDRTKEITDLQSPNLSLLTTNTNGNGEGDEVSRARLLLNDVQSNTNLAKNDLQDSSLTQRLPAHTRTRSVRFEDDIDVEPDDTWAVRSPNGRNSVDTNGIYNRALGIQGTRGLPVSRSTVLQRDLSPSSQNQTPQRRLSNIVPPSRASQVDERRFSVATFSHRNDASRLFSAIPQRVRHMLKPRVEKWGTGISPTLLYLPDEQYAREKGALRSTRLAAVGLEEDKRNLVVRGKPFKIRVVGSNLPLSLSRRKGTRVLYSESRFISWNDEKDTKNVAHAVRTGSNFASTLQYQMVRHDQSLVLDATATDEDGGIEVREIAVRVVMGETSRNSVTSDSAIAALDSALADGTVFVDGEIRWEVVPESGDMRKGSVPLRFGYYCILARPCDARLYCSAQTPENLRLVALAEAMGAVQHHDVSKRKEMGAETKTLSYVVLRVSEA